MYILIYPLQFASSVLKGGLDSEVVDFLILSEDWKKLVARRH